MNTNRFKNTGISPAVGVVLLIGITAAVATLAGIVLLDLGSPQETVTTGVQANETVDGVEVSWNQEGNAERIKVIVDGEEVGELKRINDSLVVGADSNSDISLVGVTESGAESVVGSVNTENNTSSTGTVEVKEYNTSTEQVTGQLSINPPIDGATVNAVENNTIIDSTTTDSNGEFTLNGTEESKIEFEVEGFEYTDSEGTDRKVYATVSENVPESKEVLKDIDESKLVTTNRNGETISLLYPETADGVKQIYNLTQLQGMNGELDGNYILMNNIDATETENWNSGIGFEPIGTDSDPFTGQLEGQGYTVQNLHIDRSATTRVGVFGKIKDATISNINASNVDITGDVYTGGLIGQIKSSTVTNASTTGTVTGGSGTGGLAGNNDDGSLTESSSEVTVSGTDQKTGGLVGKNVGTDATISNSYATGTVTGTNENTGGLIGLNEYGTVSESYATGSVEGARYTGGLLGRQNRSSSSTVDSYSEGTVTSTEDDTGGFIGLNDSGTITGSYAIGNVSNTSEFTRRHGGFAGHNTGTITDSYSEGNVTANGWYTGGFVGSSTQESEISQSYATGDTESSSYTGGFVGYTTDDSNIYQSYSTGSVTVSESDGKGGGFIGKNSNATITNSYTTSSVNGGETLGGFVGTNYDGGSGNGTIENVYATGTIDSVATTGGIAGENLNSISNSYWDTETTTKSSATGTNTGTVQNTTGFTTSELTGSSAETNMSNFDFNSTWTTTNNYPELQE